MIKNENIFLEYTVCRENLTRDLNLDSYTLYPKGLAGQWMIHD